MDDFWVFGYGSLMWNPGFSFEERHLATIFGYRRALCIRSWVYRGTQEHPGLVLGLDRGGSCRGVAFRVDSSEQDDVLQYLRKRELVTDVYLERILPARLADGRTVQTVSYIADRRHHQYQQALDVEKAAAVVAGAAGQAGPNDVYVLNTLSHLKDVGIEDRWLEAVAARIRAIRQEESEARHRS